MLEPNEEQYLSRARADHLDPNGVSNLRQAAAFFNVSRATWTRWEKEGRLPVQTRILNGKKCYRHSDMIEAVKQLQAA